MVIEPADTKANALRSERKRKSGAGYDSRRMLEVYAHRRRERYCTNGHCTVVRPPYKRKDDVECGMRV